MTTADKIASSESLGHIQTDRPCSKCGFNLFGQPVTRDEHYNMPIARCSECGQVAALQEYPGLGVWASRWSSMIAAVWLLLTIAMFAFTIFMATAPVGSMLDSEYSEITATIAELYLQDSRETSEAASQNLRSWNSLPQNWVESSGYQAQVRAKGPLITQLDSTYPMMVASLWLMLYAAVLPWPVIMQQSSRLKVALYLCLMFTIGAAFVGVVNWDQGQSSFSAKSLALELVWPTLLAWTYPVLFTAGILAAYTGRPLARLVIRAALPPRLRLPFASLWRADGKEMPAITGNSTNA